MKVDSKHVCIRISVEDSIIEPLLFSEDTPLAVRSVLADELLAMIAEQEQQPLSIGIFVPVYSIVIKLCTNDRKPYFNCTRSL